MQSMDHDWSSVVYSARKVIMTGRGNNDDRPYDNRGREKRGHFVGNFSHG
jgi:hypothetical protein